MKRGFTLIELLVVIAIIGMLSSVVLASLNSARTKSRDVRRLTDVRQLQTALEMYYNDHNAYPISGWTNSTAWSSAFSTALAPYMPIMPTDPLNDGSTPYYGSHSYSYYANGYGGPGQWYMIVFNLEGNHAIENQDGVRTCSGSYFHYGTYGNGSNGIITIGGNCT